LTIDSCENTNPVSFTDNVKHFLTFTFKNASRSLQQKYYEILTFLLENRVAYQKQVADFYHRDRRDYSYAFKKLVQYGIIEKVGKRTSAQSYALNQDVKKYLQKIISDNVKKSSEGVSSRSDSSSPAFSSSNSNVKPMSKNVFDISKNDAYRLHRHAAYYRYHGKQPKIYRSSHKNQERYWDYFHLHDDTFKVEFTKNYVIIHCPERLAGLNDYQKLRDQLISDLTRVVISIEQRYAIRLEYDYLTHEQENKFEIAAYDSFNAWFAEPYVRNHHTIHERDFAIDASKDHPEVDLIEHYSGGEGVRKYQAMLDLSDNLLPVVDSMSGQVLVLSQQMSQLVKKAETQEQFNASSVNLLQQLVQEVKSISKINQETIYAISDLKSAIQQDIESLRAEIQYSSIDYEKIPGKLLVHSGSIQDQILELLTQEELSAYELAEKLDLNYYKINYHLKQLIKKQLVFTHKDENQRGRGRKKLIYKLR